MLCQYHKQQRRYQFKVSIIIGSMSSKGISKALSAELVLTKTKADSLLNIKNLNLWGNDLQDLSLLEQMPNLEVISLSVNKISTLREFGNCPKLQELYLRKNNIEDIRQIKYLSPLQNLKVLWLHDNPCSQTENYREIVIKTLPSLIKLDNNAINPEDKINAQKVIFSLQGYGEQTEPIVSRLAPQKHIYQNYQKKSEAEKVAINLNSKAQNAYKSKESSKRQKQPQYITMQMNRNKNILMACLALMRELDEGSLEIMRSELDKQLRER